MRLTDEQISIIRRLARELGGPQARVRVFGSRLDDSTRGGDLDLMLELDSAVEHPAMLAARMSAQVSRALGGRKNDHAIRHPS